MKVLKAKTAGFCFGVKRALQIARAASKENIPVYMLGDIVHNEEVVKQVSSWGIKKVKTLDNGQGKALLIRAHGTGSNTYKQALNKGFKVIDATCLMVKEIHRIARQMSEKGYQIVIIGDEKHDEVSGIKGQLKKRAVVLNKDNLNLDRLKGIKKCAVVVQSTQDIQDVEKIVSRIKERVNEVRFFNTVCNPTRSKQEEIKKLAFRVDVMIVIGSKTSANTRRLYEISKQINPSTFLLSSPEELRNGWFKEAKTAGVTAGASTPDYITEKIVKRLKSLNP